MKQNKQTKENITERLAKASAQGLMIDFALNALMPGVGHVVGMATKFKTAKHITKSVAKSMANETIKMNTEDGSIPSEDDFAEHLAVEFINKRMGR